METIVQDIEAGPGQDMTVYQTVSLEDEVLIDNEEGDSFLVPFLSRLENSLRSNVNPIETIGSVLETYDDKSMIGAIGDRTGSGSDDRGPFQPINNLNGDNPITVKCNTTSLNSGGDSVDFNPSNYTVGAVITGVGGNSNLSGAMYDINWVDANTLELNGLSQNGSEDVSNAYVAPLFDASIVYGRNWDNNERIQNVGPYDLQIYLGRDGSPNDLKQPFLNEPVLVGNSDGRLSYNPMTINEPNVDANNNTSTIKLSREVENKGSVDINVNEIGVAGRHSNFESYQNANVWDFITRDTTSVTISPGSTVSFTYRIRTNANDDGGIMTNFFELMFRQFTKSSRNAKDINNNDVSRGNSRRQFYVLGKGGYRFNEALRGVQVGRSNDIVNAGNTSFQDRVPYGDGDDELFPVGSFVEKQVEDAANSRFYVDISRVFENRGTTTIDIEETGLYVGTGNAIVMIARHRTASTSVSPGDSIKVTYRFQVQP